MIEFKCECKCRFDIPKSNLANKKEVNCPNCDKKLPEEILNPISEFCKAQLTANEQLELANKEVEKINDKFSQTFSWNFKLNNLKVLSFIAFAFIFVSLIGCAKISSAEVSSRFNENKAISMVIKDHAYFPSNQGEIITKEFPIGGPPGTTAKVKFTTKVEKSSESAYAVTLTKDWGFTVNGIYLESSWKYKVTPDSVTLLEINDTDNLMNTIK